LYTTYADTLLRNAAHSRHEPGRWLTGDAQNIPGVNSTENPYATAVRKEIKDQFMVGDALLVAPLFAGQKERTVVLPKGKWYDFYRKTCMKAKS
jgi:hypothetical protein